MVEVGEAEKEVGVMAKDEEKKAEAGEVMMEDFEGSLRFTKSNICHSSKKATISNPVDNTLP